MRNDCYVFILCLQNKRKSLEEYRRDIIKKKKNTREPEVLRIRLGHFFFIDFTSRLICLKIKLNDLPLTNRHRRQPAISFPENYSIVYNYLEDVFEIQLSKFVLVHVRLNHDSVEF